MKKAILTSVALAASLNAALSDSEILSIYGGAPQGIEIKVAERIPLSEPKGVEAVVLKISQGNMSQEEIIFTQGDLIFTDIIDPKKRVVYKEQIKQDRIAGQLSKVFKAESKDNIIKLGNDPKKPTILMLTDALCPFCRKEMARIEDTLKNNNVDIVMTSVHGDDGHAKSALIYKEIKNAKTDEQKIAIFRKYYAEDNKAGAKDVSAAELNAAKALAAKYFGAGVNSVPYIIELDKLK